MDRYDADILAQAIRDGGGQIRRGLDNLAEQVQLLAVAQAMRERPATVTRWLNEYKQRSEER